MLESTISFYHYFEFLTFYELFADFFKLFKCRLFNKVLMKYTENVCEKWDITETNNLIRLVIFDNKS